MIPEIMSEIVQHNGITYKLFIRESLMPCNPLMLQGNKIHSDIFQEYVVSMGIMDDGYVDKHYYAYWEQYIDLADHLMTRFRKLKAFL